MNSLLPAMLLLGPLLFFALWPRIWFDTSKNLVDYVQFHLQHYGIYFYYFGTVYGDAFAPESGRWSFRILAARGPTIYAGTNQIQHNIIGERVLGLPKG